MLKRLSEVNLSVLLYGTCMLSRRKEKQRLVYKTLLSIRTTVETREKAVEVQLTPRFS